MCSWGIQSFIKINNMKTIRNGAVLLLLLFFIAPFSSFAQKDKYVIVDLASGETIDIYYDTLSWKTMNKTSSMPVDYYIIRYSDNTTPPDTVHGVTGIIVNNMIQKNTDGKWMFNEARVKWDGKEFKMKDKYGRKVKWEAGSLKIKDWNSKYKSEAADADAKVKEEWDKVKWKEDEVKTEIGTQKTKVKQ
jgi:hypothetical protein